jgi:hypothetical protein
LRPGAGFAAASLTVRTEHRGINGQSLFDTKNRFTQRQVNSQKRILTTLCSGLRAPRAASAKEAVKNVTKPEALAAAPVVSRPGVCIGKNFVGVGYELEALLSVGARVYVGVQLAGKLAIGLFYLILSSGTRYP